MQIEKSKIALELLKNSSIFMLRFNISYGNIMKTFLEDYLKKIDSGEKLNEDLLDFDSCVEYMRKCCFDITGWMLWEKSTSYSYCHFYCFYNESTKKAFDLVVLNGEVTPRYIASGNEEDANTIEEAIEKYEME